MTSPLLPLHITVTLAHQALELIEYLSTTYANISCHTPNTTLQLLLDTCHWRKGGTNPQPVYVLDTAQMIDPATLPPDALFCWVTITQATPAEGSSFLQWQAQQPATKLAAAAKRGAELHKMLQRKNQELHEKYTESIDHTFPPAMENHLAATSIDKLYKCPFRFYTERRLGHLPEDEDAPTAAARGNLTHQWLESIFKTRVDPTAGHDHVSQTLEDVLANIPAFSAALWRPRLEVLLPDIQQAYLDYLQTPTAKAWPEEKLNKTYAGLRLSAKVDLYIKAEDTSRVIDHKTGTAPTKADVKNQKNKQMPLSWWLAQQQISETEQPVPHDIEVWEIPFKRQGRFQITKFAHTDMPEDFAETLTSGLQTLADTLPHHGYPAVPGEHCTYCRLAGICRKAEWETHHDG